MNNKKSLQKAQSFINSNFYVYLKICDNLADIPDEQLKTLIAISRFMQNAYPTIETISKMTGRSSRTVMRDIKKLESLGIISVKRKHREANVYNFSLGDKAMSLNEDLGCQNQASRVTKTGVLGDKAMSPHYNNHINNYIKGDFLKIDDEKSEDAIEARRQFVISLTNKEPLE